MTAIVVESQYNHIMQDILLAKHDSLTWARHDSVDRARHKTDFEVLNVLGQGAFGTAYKVKNRVDSRIYALKSVRIDRSGIFGSSDDCAKALREVEVLSSLNSENVVRYYAAWVEKGDKLEKEEDGGEYSSWSLEEERTSSTDDTGSSRFALLDPKVDPTCHLCQSTYKEWEVSFEHWGLINAVLQPLDLCTSCYWKSVPLQVDASKITIRQKKILPEYLFILMGFCEYTLSEAVAACQDDNIKLWSYFAQCVQGLAYLHSKGVIHRDVKPNNLFVHEGVVKIGDMGLATQSPRTAAGEMAILASISNDDDCTTTSKSSQVGTFLYTAPEVATGQYNEKCDVYSLGVVLVEMFSKFHTGMERVEVLGKLLRSENEEVWLPEEWVLAHPIQARLARQMVSVDPSARPTCHQVLGELLVEGLWVEPNVNSMLMTSVVTALQEQIVELRSESQAKDKTISQLRQLLEDNRIGHNHIA
jgi:translation initiation factor 2-alpha kinase 4